MESFKVGPLKTSISQPLKNASFLGLDGCEIEVFNGSGFTLLKHRIRDTRELFLRKQVFSEKNPPALKNESVCMTFLNVRFTFSTLTG